MLTPIMDNMFLISTRTPPRGVTAICDALFHPLKFLLAPLREG